MPHLPTILITLLLAVPAMSVELFRYQGAAKDGGTLEYVIEVDEQEVAEIAADFMTTFYSLTGRSTGNAGISDNARSVLAYLLGHDPSTDATNVLCRLTA